MAIWLCLRWWYSTGWHWALQRGIIVRLQRCNDSFSILALMRSWFAPFKQTSRPGSGSISMRFRVLVDNIISRFVGFFARTFIIIGGLIWCVFIIVTGVIFVILWPFVPISWLVAIILIVAGVGR